MNQRTSTASILAFVTFWAIVVVISDTNAQDTFEPPSWDDRLSDLVYMNWSRNTEVSECVECHLAESIGSMISGKKDVFGEFSRRDEMERWLTQDKHTIARRRVEPFSADESRQQLKKMLKETKEHRSKLLQKLVKANYRVEIGELAFDDFPEQWVGMSNVLSRRMCDKLFGEGAVKQPAGYAKFRDQCLTCHGGYEIGSSDKAFDFAGLGKSAQLGIDCMRCHQSGEQTDWVANHTKPKTWRLKKPSEKQADGMRDLVNTSRQASLCADCHIGNRGKGMFVNHEMYAAGHPPLPSIEMHEFSQQMPQHWQSPKQLHASLEKYAQRDQYFQINYPGLTKQVSPKDIFWNTRKTLVGALQSQIQYLSLFQEAANDGGWADYALYDCAACHHELESKSLRQRRGFDGPPGRPRSHEWFTVIMHTAVLLAEKENADAYDRLETQFNQAFYGQPFGSSGRVSQIANSMTAELEKMVQTAERRPINAKAAQLILKKYASTPAPLLLTYDSARELAWAIKTVSAELNDHKVELNGEVKQAIAQLMSTENTGIELSIPSGRDQYIYRESLEVDLKRRAEFDPARFILSLKQLDRALRKVR
ncbi:hypothetical protein [Rubripirellula obstinata]|nr:hypothetical protein [Rubripirellula obstinata]